MTKLQWSFVIWGPWVMYFAAFELWAVFNKRSKWFTLSTTTGDIEKWWWPIQFVILFGLAILLVHWSEKGPVSLAATQAKRLVKKRAL